ADDVDHGGATRLHLGAALREAAQGRGDTYDDRHKRSFARSLATLHYEPRRPMAVNCVIKTLARASWLPLGLLLAYGIAFATQALGIGPLAFDDHPGQLARLWHVLREGPAPWAWNDGWWAGYAELQFYPP